MGSNKPVFQSIFACKSAARKLIDKRNVSRPEWWLNVDYTEEVSCDAASRDARAQRARDAH